MDETHINNQKLRDIILRKLDVEYQICVLDLTQCGIRNENLKKMTPIIPNDSFIKILEDLTRIRSKLVHINQEYDKLK